MTGKPSYGVVVKMGDANPPTITLTNVVSVGPPKFTRDAVDTTNHGSSGGAMEAIPDGVYDPGEMVVTMNYVAGDANDDACIAAFASGTLKYFSHTVNAASTTETRGFAGVITEYGPDELPVKGKQTASLKIKVSGPVAQGATS
ncbi:UNVERIFIED_ORG: hypothetical protein M2348_001068 [Sphingomonas sp. R1F5B]